MKNDGKSGIKVHSDPISSVIFVHLVLIYIAVMYALLLIYVPMSQIFPALQTHSLILSVPTFLCAFLLCLYFLTLLSTAMLEKETITLKWCGIPVRTISVSDLRLLCACGNYREDYLCLTCRSVEDLAHQQEKRLRKSLLNRHDIPLLKRKDNWQDTFAREYLSYIRRKPFGFIQNRNAVMLPMDPALHYILRQLYPHLPYRNLTGITSAYSSRFSCINENQAVCFPLQFCDYLMELKPDGIHISKAKKELFILPAQQIKTAVCIDVFSEYDKYTPHHMPLLFLSELTEEELAALAPKQIYGEMPTPPPLMVMLGASHKARHWKVTQKNCCVIHYTEQNLRTVRTLYPNIQINGISANWLQDSEPSPVGYHE